MKYVLFDSIHVLSIHLFNFKVDVQRLRRNITILWEQSTFVALFSILYTFKARKTIIIKKIIKNIFNMKPITTSEKGETSNKHQFLVCRKWGTERDKVSTLNLAWLLSRTHATTAQHVPSWCAFNEGVHHLITVNPPVTTAGMMPILEVHIDDNDNMTSV